MAESSGMVYLDRIGWILDEAKKSLCSPGGEGDDPLPLKNIVGFVQGGLDKELVKGRPDSLGRCGYSLVHLERHLGWNSLFDFVKPYETPPSLPAE